MRSSSSQITASLILRDMHATLSWMDGSSHKEGFISTIIPFEKRHAARFIARIEDALQELYKRGVLGAPPKYLTAIDRSKARWTKDWLASYVQLLPPEPIAEHSHRSVVAFPQIVEAGPAAPTTNRQRKTKSSHA